MGETISDLIGLILILGEIHMQVPISMENTVYNENI
jgi:hypothetical protein